MHITSIRINHFTIIHHSLVRVNDERVNITQPKFFYDLYNLVNYTLNEFTEYENNAEQQLLLAM